MIVPIPIFIHVREKSDKELREEIEREDRWKKILEADRKREEERKRRIEDEKRQKEEDERKRIDSEYEAEKRKNPWDFQFMPEGWSIFGQTFFGPISG